MEGYETDTDRLEQPVSDRYPDGEEPTTPPTEREEFDPESENWVNYWDLNPIAHGGTFIRWDDDHEAWTVIEVTPPSAWRENAHLIERMTVYPPDVWEDTDDPLTDFTGEMKDILRSLSDDHHIPNAEPFLEGVTYYVADFTHRLRGERNDQFTVTNEDGEETETTVEDYWDELSSWGVEVEDVVGVHSSSLPDEILEDGTKTE